MEKHYNTTNKYGEEGSSAQGVPILLSLGRRSGPTQSWLSEGSKNMAVMRLPNELTRALAMSRPIVRGSNLMGSNIFIVLTIRGVREVQAPFDTTVIAVKKEAKLLLPK
jgi:hypothetical protein